MANHSYVTTRQILTHEKIDLVVRAVTKNYFGDLAKVDSPDSLDKDGWWEVTFEDDPTRRFSFWVCTRRKLEFRHPFGALSLPYWGQHVLIEEFATRLNGWIRDDALARPYKPDLKRVNTYKKWLDLLVEDPMDRHRIIEALSKRAKAIPALGVKL